MTEEKTPEKASTPTPSASASAAGESLPLGTQTAEPESSAAYIAAGAAAAPDSGPPASTGTPAQSRASAAGGPKPGLLVLVVLAVVVGGLVSLYLVRQSPWLAEKILKEQKIQAVEDGKDPPAAPSDAAVSSSDTGGSTATAGVSAPRSEVVSDTAERLDSVPPVMVAVPSPRLDPVVAQRIGQMQQWAIILQGLPAGPIDPSAALPTVLTATGDSTSDSAPAASDRPVKIVPTPAIGSQDNPAPDSSAAATPDPVVVDPFGTRLGRWFDGALESTGRFLGSLVRVQQVEDTTLAGQSQAFFAQVNQRAQSHLLSARLLMLHDQHRLAGEELGALLELLRRYYDPADVRVTKMRDEVSQLRAALKEPA